MIACTWFVSTARSTPLTISVPSSSATCRFFSSSNAKVCDSSPLADERLDAPVRDAHGSQAHADGSRAYELAAQAERRPERRVARAIVEAAVRDPAAGEGLEEVVRRIDRLVLARDV